MRRSLRALTIPLLCAGSVGAAACGSGGGPQYDASDTVRLGTPTLPDAQSGGHYQEVLTAYFPHPPGRYSVVEGQLPTGLELDRVNGVIEGWCLEEGVFAFTIEARDGDDFERDRTFPSDRRRYVVEISKGPVNFIPLPLPLAVYRTNYQHSLIVAGGTPPYTFQMTGGVLPAGVSLLGDGTLAGTPTQASQDPYVFVATVADSTGAQDTDSFDFFSTLPALIIGSATLPEAALRFAYSFQIALASSGAKAGIEWSQAPPGPGEVTLSSIGMQLTTTGLLTNVPGVGPAPLGDHAFTVQVVDEASQQATRQYTLRVNPGPVLTSITPNRAYKPGPYVVAGLNFQNKATLTFGTGGTATTITPTFVSPTQLQFATAPTSPGGGLQDVRVTNPDAGFHVLPKGFGFPATTLSFSTTRVLPSPNSALSSTGLAVGDVNKDGFADVVHCGTGATGGSWSNATGTAGGVDLLLNAPSGGVFDASSATFAKVSIATTGDWHQVKLADMDADGDLDVIAVGNVAGVKVVRVWVNPYPSAFTAGMAFQQGTLPFGGAQTGHVSDMALGFMAGADTVPDLAYVHQDPMVVTAQSSSYSYTRNYFGESVSTAKITGVESGAFTVVSLKTDKKVPNLAVPAGVALGQFNGDAVADPVVSDQVGGYEYWSGWGAPQGVIGVVAMTTSSTGIFGTWNPLTDTTAGTPTVEFLGVAAGDINGDGRDDAVFAGATDQSSGGWGGSPAIVSFEGSASGVFKTLPVVKPTDRMRYVALFDADFDASQDIVASGGVPGAFDKLNLYKGGSGAGKGPTFKQQVNVNNPGGLNPNVGRVAAGDFDDDGRDDVCVALSFFADAMVNNNSSKSDRGNGATLGVAIFLNTSD